ESGKLFLLDSVSGAGAAELEIDEWGVDVCVTASQKAWGAPPGVAMVTMSPRAWKAYEKSNLPKSYFDLAAYKASLEKAQTPATAMHRRPSRRSDHRRASMRGISSASSATTTTRSSPAARARWRANSFALRTSAS